MAERKAVYVVVKGKGEKSFWTRIGVAFVNRDGSLNVKLEALPVSGELHIRDFKERDEPNGRDRRDGGRSYEREHDARDWERG